MATSTVTVSSSAATIPSDGSAPVTITAVAKDANNAALSGEIVTFAASAGNITVTQGTTDATGTATATLVAGSAAPGATITVTATSGTASGKVSVTVANTQKTLTLLTSLPQIPSDGSKSAAISALVRDSNNNAVSGTAVSFQATSGLLTVTAPTTDAAGTATATLGTAGDPTDRPITVTAQAGTASATITVNVVGTKLTLSGPTNLVQAATPPATYTVALTDSSGNGIPNQTVTLTSSAGNTLTPATYMTDSTGQKTIALTAANSGSDTITATALGLTATQSITVSGQKFVFTTPTPPVPPTAPTNVNLGVVQQLTVQWTNPGIAIEGTTITFAATRGTFVQCPAPAPVLGAPNAAPVASGQATVCISSTVAGPAVVTASTPAIAATATAPASPIITAQANIEFISISPAAINLQASPATIPTLGQSTLTAVVRDASNNLVENQIVTFQTVGDTTGGTLSVPSAVTDSQGRATTVYTASSTPSATNGVAVQATVQSAPTVTATAKLTVGGISVGLSIGTGNQITELPVGCASASAVLCTEFQVSYVVFATDTAGNPVANVPVTMTVHALDYVKGYWNESVKPYVHATSNGGVSYGTSNGTYCPNEDSSQLTVVPADVFDGVLQAGEDGCQANPALGLPVIVASTIAPAICNVYGNRNGKLDPGVTAVASPGSQTTAADGTAQFNIIYPESIATWVDVQLIASAAASGTEATASVSFTLPIAAKYLQGPGDPPGQPSPYGVDTSCTNPN